MGADADVDWVVGTSIEAMRHAGATVVDLALSEVASRCERRFLQRHSPAGIPGTDRGVSRDSGTEVSEEYPGNDRTRHRFTVSRPDGARPNSSRWAMFKAEAASGTLEDYRYKSVRDFGLPMVRSAVEGMLASQQLDAIVYPTSPRKPALIAATQEGGRGDVGSATNIANLTGFPDLIVPAGFTGNALPVGISFFGPAFSEQRLLSLGYSFEQATHARSRPVNTPPLKGESISLP